MKERGSEIGGRRKEGRKKEKERKRGKVGDETGGEKRGRWEKKTEEVEME